MMRVVYTHVHEPVKARIEELMADDSTIEYEGAYNAIIDAFDSGAITLDDLPYLTLQAQPQEQKG